ncbi:MAG: hypothetical protein LQ340_001200 [Diploschistes diacapsis]|nr:MAG: hypothetical protein LQ340_001200 [Diploschistes diacapsis]
MPPQALKKHLKSLPETAAATHHILAWRVLQAESTTLAKHFQPTSTNAGPKAPALESGSDDDGERYGGRHVLKVLEAEGAQGALVVARWYGGIMLGPVRFTHIEDMARQAIREWRRDNGGWEQGLKAAEQKRPKLLSNEGSEGEKARLVGELVERDANIVVLRDLLREKREGPAKAKSEQNGGHHGDEVGLSQPASSLAKKVDYAGMALEALQRIDRARDSTVAFLLKKIDEAEQAEAQQKQVLEEKGLEGDQRLSVESPNDEAGDSVDRIRNGTRNGDGDGDGDGDSSEAAS